MSGSGTSRRRSKLPGLGEADIPRVPRQIDTSKPHSARMYDFFLGGKDHFKADRETAERAMRSWPAVKTAVRENRSFLGRAVRFLVKEAGVRQFLDIGTGLPSADNVHEVAQSLDPTCRVVYVDNDHCNSGCAHARRGVAAGEHGTRALRARGTLSQHGSGPAHM